MKSDVSPAPRAGAPIARPPVRPQARPVGLAAIVSILFLFSIFLIITVWVYHPEPAALPFNVPAANLPKDQLDTATPAARMAYLEKLRAEHLHQLETYSWRDPAKQDIVRIPIQRAMELVVEKYGK